MAQTISLWVQAQYAGAGYIEINIDVEVSAMAKHILNAVKPLSRSLVLDLAFVIEGQARITSSDISLCVPRLMNSLCVLHLASGVVIRAGGG